MSGIENMIIQKVDAIVTLLVDAKAGIQAVDLGIRKEYKTCNHHGICFFMEM